MQLIAETFDLMQNSLGMKNDQIADTFGEWNRAELDSFLIEITETVLRRKDDKTGEFLVNEILDTAGQKGTGKWTSQAAMDLGIPVPTIDSAVTMRQLSAMKTERVTASKNRPAVSEPTFTVDHLRKALHAAFILTYAQGLSMLQHASTEMKFGIKLTQVAQIWRGGCIIRAALLEDIRQAFEKNPDLLNLMVDENFAQMLHDEQGDLRGVVAASAMAGFPSYCMMSSLAYHDAYHTARLPANLIQAQRDFFGAHTYLRIDRGEEIFHTPDWVVKKLKEGKQPDES
jgi:6-phosphogluconate dehydrogenase